MFLSQLVLLMALASAAENPAAGVIVGVTGHVVVQGAAGSSKAATLGMRLDPNDVVVLERGAAASIYIKGGGVVRLHDATRFEMPKAAVSPAAASQAKLKSGTIAQLESGLWVLNDPGGSLLVSPMRGDASEVTVPLTPRYEALTLPVAVFLWVGGPAKARVVVAKQRDVVWKSDPERPETVVAAGPGLKLAAGEVYTWWLEPEAGGAPLTAGIPFRVATADVIERTKSLEAELNALRDNADGAAAADYLLLAHYTGASSWTRVLELAGRMAPGEAHDRALAAARDGLRLDERGAAALEKRLAEGSKR